MKNVEKQEEPAAQSEIRDKYELFVNEECGDTMWDAVLREDEAKENTDKINF
jgi:hypothetical protein